MSNKDDLLLGMHSNRGAFRESYSVPADLIWGLLQIARGEEPTVKDPSSNPEVSAVQNPKEFDALDPLDPSPIRKPVAKNPKESATLDLKKMAAQNLKELAMEDLKNQAAQVPNLPKYCRIDRRRLISGASKN